jgi:UDP-GlcNAc:undecaprenyl-phosphate GlcNAc-1-phosphate transferase
MNLWILIIIGLVLGTFIISFLITPLCRKMAFRWNIIDNPGHRKIHHTPKAYLGGVAIFFSMTLVISSGIFAGYFVLPKLGFLPPEIPLYLKNIHIVGLRLTGLLICGFLAFLLGLIDDIKRLSPKPKFYAQIGIAILAVLMGIKLDLFLPVKWLSGVLTVIWIVGIMNAMNFMDNMDGLSSGVAAIASFLFLIYSLMTGHIYMSLVLAVFLGSILGFLPYNFPSSSIFMGDAGSLFIGFQLASLTVLNSYYYNDAPTFLPVFLPIFVLSVPIFDMLTVVSIRIKNHKPVYVGDTNHFSHRLLALGLSTRQALLLIYFITFCTGAGALLLPSLKLMESMLVLAQMITIFAIITVLEVVGRNKKN